ncbi:MAG: Crp/Fnr family transcriptional regulator [Chitinophagaceae bacterium]|jgi:CRP/FNR family transcriptional regulator|nr:Crp/Fnr family transcriptional regulator [Chitinophagaceae bacterium]
MKTFEHVDCSRCDKRQYSVFCSTHGEHLDEISNSKTCSVYKKGQVVFHEGGHPFGIYCVNKGKIKLSIIGDEGKEQIVRMARDGDVLGYRSMLVNERYNATATVLEDSQICFVPREVFMRTLKSDNSLSFEVMKLLSNQLREAEVKLTHLAQKPVRERLAETLLFLKETYGFEPDSTFIAVQLTREEIANLVGTATETAIRLLSELNREEVIELSGKRIAIKDMRELARVANLND